MYPFKLSCVTRRAVWGSERWELTVREKENSVILNGAFSGWTLGDVIAGAERPLVAPNFGSPSFPLLVKLIDAEDRLSVQVHPNDAYAARMEGDSGKTEMWYIADAEPGAEIVCGLRAGVTKDDFARAIRSGETERVLRRQPVCKGETYFIPAGLVHAIGKGIRIAEIQQNCDVTYRVYDYDRIGADGNPRALHVEKALDSVRLFDAEEIERQRFSCCSETLANGEVLADCDCFRVERLALSGECAELPNCAKMRHLLCLEGTADLCCCGEIYRIAKGADAESWFLPPDLPATIGGSALLLVSSI